jgi:hypothetical protein
MTTQANYFPLPTVHAQRSFYPNTGPNGIKAKARRKLGLSVGAAVVRGSLLRDQL